MEQLNIIERLHQLTGKSVVLHESCKTYSSISQLSQAFKIGDFDPSSKMVNIAKWKYEFKQLTPSKVETSFLFQRNGGEVKSIFKPVTDGANKGNLVFVFKISDGMIVPKQAQYDK